MDTMMKQIVGEYLEVPGEVVMIRNEIMTVPQIKKEINKILDKHKRCRIKKLEDIPEGSDKRRIRELLRALGFEIKF